MHVGKREVCKNSRSLAAVLIIYFLVTSLIFVSLTLTTYAVFAIENWDEHAAVAPPPRPAHLWAAPCSPVGVTTAESSGIPRQPLTG